MLFKNVLPLLPLHTYFASEQMNDLKRVLEDSDSHQLLAVVAAVHHQRVGDSFDDGALGLTESLGGIPSSTVGQKLGIFLLDCQVILKSRNKLNHMFEKQIYTKAMSTFMIQSKFHQIM